MPVVVEMSTQGAEDKATHKGERWNMMCCCHYKCPVHPFGSDGPSVSPAEAAGGGMDNYHCACDQMMPRDRQPDHGKFTTIFGPQYE